MIHHLEKTPQYIQFSIFVVDQCRLMAFLLSGLLNDIETNSSTAPKKNELNNLLDIC